MIAPTRQWCIQIEVTNACPRRCANCTRALAHAREPFFITRREFCRAVGALMAFPDDSEPDAQARPKIVGLIGGEPLVHPEFRRLVDIFCEMIPRRSARGCWTGVDLSRHRYGELIRRRFGYVNENLHEPPSRHHPILVSVSEVARTLFDDQAEAEQWMWQQIDACWLQPLWSSSITPKGFFFCEVAAALDLVFDGPGGLPVDPTCWRQPLAAYREQIERWCPRCGIPLRNLRARPDRDRLDDVSPQNLRELRRLGSPRIQRGEYQTYNLPAYDPAAEPRSTPWRYLAEAP